MNYNSLGAFLEKNADNILPDKGDMSPKNFLSSVEVDTICYVSWVTYCNDWQSILKQMLDNLSKDLWGSDFSVQILFTLGPMGRGDKLSIWVVPCVAKKVPDSNFK